jgi:hypothetical protein
VIEELFQRFYERIIMLNVENISFVKEYTSTMTKALEEWEVSPDTKVAFYSEWFHDFKDKLLLLGPPIEKTKQEMIELQKKRVEKANNNAILELWEELRKFLTDKTDTAWHTYNKRDHEATVYHMREAFIYPTHLEELRNCIGHFDNDKLKAMQERFGNEVTDLKQHMHMVLTIAYNRMKNFAEARKLNFTPNIKVIRQ